MLSKAKLIQILCMLVLFIALFSWRTLTARTNNDDVDIVRSEVVTMVEEGVFCDFSRPCTANTPWGTFNLSVEEGKVVPEDWFHVTLQSDAATWHVNQAKILNNTMFMGKIPMRFSDVELHQSHARTMIGACTEDTMSWRFEIDVTINEQPMTLKYNFEAER